MPLNCRIIKLKFQAPGGSETLGACCPPPLSPSLPKFDCSLCAGTAGNQDKCEEFEDELAGIREDFIDMLGDGWVVKLIDSALLPRYRYYCISLPLLATSVGKSNLSFSYNFAGSRSEANDYRNFFLFFLLDPSAGEDQKRSAPPQNQIKFGYS